MSFTPPVLVDAPVGKGLRYGLFTAANGPYDLPSHGRAGGIVYEPVTCGFARTHLTLCHTDKRLAEKTFDSNDPTTVRDSFVVYSSLVCGTAGKTAVDIEGKVLQRLYNGEQTVAEAGLATILAAGATPILAPGVTLVDVIGELEQWLYGVTPDSQYGQVGYLHASPRIAAHAMDRDLLVPDGKLLRTRMGTIWIFGGYPDDGTIYISGNVSVWRSPDVFVSPMQLNKTTNQVYALAEREYVVTYDCLAASAVYNWGIPT